MNNVRVFCFVLFLYVYFRSSVFGSSSQLKKDSRNLSDKGEVGWDLGNVHY